MSLVNDNRNYCYEDMSSTERVEFSVIEKLVGRGNKIIDLGCGDGSLMQLLEVNDNVCYGVEVSPSGVAVCKRKGLKVVKGRIDQKIPFNDKEFDYAVCSVTLHMVMYPEILIKEMRRVSKRQILTFPNFAFILNRLELMFLGRFPRWSLFGYQWFSTGHIHQLSIKDFRVFCKERDIKVVKEKHLFPTSMGIKLLDMPLFDLFMKRLSNLFATMAIFVIE